MGMKLIDRHNDFDESWLEIKLFGTNAALQHLITVYF
jgi:hypothetical protein